MLFILLHVRSLASPLRRRISMKRSIVAIALSFTLFGSALAGEIPSGGYTTPLPPPNVTATIESTGDIPN